MRDTKKCFRIDTKINIKKCQKCIFFQAFWTLFEAASPLNHRARFWDEYTNSAAFWRSLLSVLILESLECHSSHSMRQNEKLFIPLSEWSFFFLFWYIDTSVLLETTPLVKFIRKLHPGPEWRIFHILTSKDIGDVISRLFTVVYANCR